MTSVMTCPFEINRDSPQYVNNGSTVNIRATYNINDVLAGGLTATNYVKSINMRTQFDKTSQRLYFSDNTKGNTTLKYRWTHPWSCDDYPTTARLYLAKHNFKANLAFLDGHVGDIDLLTINRMFTFFTTTNDSRAIFWGIDKTTSNKVK